MAVPLSPRAALLKLSLLLICGSIPGQDLGWVTDRVFAPDGSDELRAAMAAETQTYEGRALDKAAFVALERAITRSGVHVPLEIAPRRFTVAVPGGWDLDVLVAVPPEPVKKPTPLILAFGGGPVPQGDRFDRRAEGQGRMMRDVWKSAAAKAGWLVASVVDDISRSRIGIRYEVVRPNHLEAVLRGIRRHYDVDENRTFMTGISLGSNYALQCGASAPELFCGAVPVATEGEGRASVLRNLGSYPAYVLVGTKDRNIKTISGPRAFRDVMKKLAYDHVYEEDTSRGHVGFQHRYDDVLAWMGKRPRNVWPRRVVRSPHGAILAPRLQRYWVGADTRQGAFDLRVNGNTITGRVASLTQLHLELADHLVDLDKPVKVVINGVDLGTHACRRSASTALRSVRKRQDRRWVPAARLRVSVPAAVASNAVGVAFRKELADPLLDEIPPMAHWEHYAWRHLRETRAVPGWAGKTEALTGGRCAFVLSDVRDGGPASQAGLRAGDRVVSFDGNPFFVGDDAGGLIELWCRREELSGEDVPIGIRRDDLSRVVRLRLPKKTR